MLCRIRENVLSKQSNHKVNPYHVKLRSTYGFTIGLLCVSGFFLLLLF